MSTIANDYWIPEILPEPTEEWNSQQLNKNYLKPDGSITSHPKWYFANTAYASDEYFYHNEGWFTVIDEKPEETDDDGNVYIIVDAPSDEWETFEEYKTRKKYKKYLHIAGNKPEYKFGTVIEHEFDFDNVNMTATDVYNESTLSDSEFQKLSDDTLSKIRTIRTYILSETDYLVMISKEKNIPLSEEFINYRQILRDIPETLNLNSLSEIDVYQIEEICYKINTPNYLMADKLTIDAINISFIPQKPDVIFEEL